MLNNISALHGGAAPKSVVTGGTLYSDSTYFYRVFTANGSLVVTTAALTHDILLVGGGGSGAIGKTGTFLGMGAGSGQVLAYAAQSLLGTKSITIGGGGTALTSGTIDTNGNSGTASTYQDLTSATFGGGGLFNTGVGGTSGNGFAGGSPNSIRVGGGGGSGAVGQNASGSASGAGGAGVNTITNWGAFADLFSASGLGVSGYISGGGGGGGANPSNLIGAGGSGGGGSGASPDPNAAAGNGTSNTGSGGGGGSYLNHASGQGGSGLCVIRYLKADV
jgi:hypothetical protein